MSVWSLINGKHPKQIIIDYYDDLINQLDIYAEESLEKISNTDESIDDNIPPISIWFKIERDPDLYKSIEKRFDDPYHIRFKHSLPIKCAQNVLLKDFVHSERIKAINVIKEIQKERLEEVKLAAVKPTTREEALFGKKFAFLLKIDNTSAKFKLLTLIADFYLDENQVKICE
jgi:hypothetical protein